VTHSANDSLNTATFIVLATRNGGPYLHDQLDSLLEQSIGEWTLLARDDGSTDDTLGILHQYAGRDNRIEVLPSLPEELGSASRNFSGLLEAARQRGAAYVFCCDQDDVWAPGKLERMLATLQEAEGAARSACLLHHDLAVVDEWLQPIAESYWSLMHITPGDERGPQRLLSRNEVTGCALACNRALLEIALPIPNDAIMHDWWLALCAAYIGKLKFLDVPLVQYRQHPANVIGARSFWSGLYHARDWADTWRKGNCELVTTVRQAEALHERLGSRLGPAAEAGLCAWRDLLQANPGRRISLLHKAGAWRHHWLLDTTLILRALLLRSVD
jgi:glycosyltransferase involved in cell wall biosynthesis